jgi:signal transduction histidine kinase
MAFRQVAVGDCVAVPYASRAMNERIGSTAASLMRSRWSLDVALGVGVAILNVTTTVTPAPESTYYDYREPHLLLLLTVMAGSGLVLIWRCHAPMTVAFIVLAIFGLVTYAEWQPGSIAVSIMIALYSVGAHSNRKNGIVILLAVIAVSITMVIFERPFFENWLGLVTVPIFLAPWFVGRVMLRYRVAGERERARVIALERQQAVEAERAVHEERLRIAREMHDVISHTLTAINVQSAVARYLVGESNAAANALTIIEESSHAALEDLRRMLGVLRSGNEAAALAPAAGVDELHLLVAAHRASHGPVELTVDEAISTSPASLRLTVFRLVQESLTNVARHARGSSALVSVRAVDDTVVVTVLDDGTGLSKAGVSSGQGEGGFGISGMRERVALFGGSFESGPGPGGGFQVKAVLPMDSRQ